MAARLTERGVCREPDIIAGRRASTCSCRRRRGIAAKRTLFLGTPRLREFRYREMTQFARRAIEVIGESRTAGAHADDHGARRGYGLDVAEALAGLIFGFQQGLTTRRCRSWRRSCSSSETRGAARVADAAARGRDRVRSCTSRTGPTDCRTAAT